MTAHCWLRLRMHTFFGEGAEARSGGGEFYNRCTRCKRMIHTGTTRPPIGLSVEYYERMRRDQREQDLRSEVADLRRRVSELENPRVAR